MTVEQENEHLKNLLYGVIRTCDNCGYVDCENFQRQRRSIPCINHKTFQERILELAEGEKK